MKTQYVVGFAFDRNSVALIRKNRPEWQKGNFNGIGGHIEKGETPLNAMIREFKEEAGIECNLWTKFCEMRFPEAIVHCFYVHIPFLENARSMTDEVIHIVKLDEIFNQTIIMIDNIPWLVAMAMRHRLSPYKYLIIDHPHQKEPNSEKDTKEYDLPVNYDKLHWSDRKAVREQYVREQQNKCLFCGESFDDNPPKSVTDKPLNWSLFPPNFLKHPIHLQHDHKTGMTEGAVHSYCNAVMWQYHGR